MTTIIAREKSLKARRTFSFERALYLVFLICGLTAVICVAGITLYMVISGGPAIAKIGVKEFLLGTSWNPNNGKFGILPMILSSIVAAASAIAVALPVGVIMAVFLSKLAPNKVTGILRAFVELLAGIPSVVYGLLGATIIVPMIHKLQTANNVPAGGSLLAAVIILIIMILPTIVSVSETAIRAVPRQYEEASLALGSTRLQSIFKVTVPAAKSGIVAGMVLGVGRAMGEAMAVTMVAGNAVMMPDFLQPVRLLTPAIPFEWAYSSGTHRDALIGIGLVLFVFIMIINIILNTTLKRGLSHDR